MRLHVFFLGGTISMTPVEDGPGVRPGLGADRLLAGLEPPPGAEITGEDFRSVGSSHLAFDDLLDLHRAARAAVADGADGVIVVQGTDSLEETSALLDLWWDHEAPVVFTGAMRHPALPGADGPANLSASLRVAAHPDWRDLGVLAVLGDEVHAARFVAKTHTSSPAAFVSPEAGPLGRMVEGVPVRLTGVRRRAPLPVPATMPRRVPILTAALDDDPDLVRLVAEASEGLVVAGFGAGHVRPAVAEVLGEAVSRIPVVLASRTGGGSVHARTYAGPGSEQDLLGRGLISAGTLTPLKARLVLAVLIGCGADRAATAEAFRRLG